MSGNSIDLHLRHGFPGFELDVALSLPDRGVTGLFGASGSGKTTLLRCIAGLTRAREGFLRVRDSLWQDGRRFLPTHRRPLGYVFQEASLFPHLNVMGNLRYAWKRAPGEPDPDHFHQVVELLGLSPLLDRGVDAISGGERQRVAIARALLIRPGLLLMDEPMASLDEARRSEIMPYLDRLHRELAIPVIYVSHSMEEIARLADHLVVLDRGRVLASGPLGETLARLDFPLELGADSGVVWEGRVAERDPEWQLARVACPGGDLWLQDQGRESGEPVRLRILARDVSLSLSPHDDTSILNRLPAEVTAIGDSGTPGIAHVRLTMQGAPLLARVTRRSVAHLGLSPGLPIWVQIKSVALIQ